MEVTLAVSRRAGHCWSAGVRTFILIIPLILWLMGPTSLLVTSVVLLLFLVSTDFVRVQNTTHAAGDVDELQARSTCAEPVFTDQVLLCCSNPGQRGCKAVDEPAVACAGPASVQEQGQRACSS